MVRIITIIKQHKKKFIIVGACSFLLLGVGYVSRGWLRVSVYPRLYALKYKNHVHGVTAETYYRLGNPFAFLGLTNLDSEQTHCKLERASKLKTSLTCFRAAEASKTLKTPDDFAQYKQWITTLSKELVNQGWAVNKTYSIVNSQPLNEASAAKLDAVTDMLVIYEISTKGVNCSLDISFYDQPDGTSSLISDMLCSHTNYYFGKP